MAYAIGEKIFNELPESHKKKYEQLALKFEENFNEKVQFFARAPGRVNLIGEHIDYCGYSVLPMAIEHDIIVAASTNSSSRLHLTNFNDNEFSKHEVDVRQFTIDKTKPKWHDYYLSGFKGILEKFNINDPVGMNICLYGEVPKSAGLSSSSAVVVSAALCTVFANRIHTNKTELAETCAISEQYVGTQGGGMDQAISCLAESNAAKRIDFNPLRVTNVSLPPGCLFVVSNSCVEINKGATNHYNTRVVECRLASQVLAKSQGLDWRQIRKPIDLQRALGLSLLELIDLTKQVLHAESYTIEEISRLLETSVDDLVATSLTSNTANLNTFQLKSRVLHVFSEAQRVYDFESACSMTNEQDEAFRSLGRLMNESHESCRVDYECSCAELDELTDICRASGAYGSRLTGAGWGGCAVSLVARNNLDAFLLGLKKLYYSKSKDLLDKFDESAFATMPSDGICIVLP